MPTITEDQREASRIYKEHHPASVCVCGHTGDGMNSHHGMGPVSPGHGPCRVEGCACVHFRWERFRIPYKQATGVK
jgi:hypothetical protein